MTHKRGLNCDVPVLVHVYVEVLLYGAMNFISFYSVKDDPGTPKSPSWEVTPELAEIAVEGRNKTLYCFAVGR